MGPRPDSASAANGARAKLGSSFGGSALAHVEDQDKVLQAVILADVGDDTFMPLTADRPAILLPVVHQPVLEYMLECLADSQVQETFILCHRFEEALKQYLTTSRWNRPHSPMRIRVIVARDIGSVGDALRELDHRALFHNDFILMTGCVISTIKLTAALEEHRARRVKDKNAILTSVMRKVQPGHRVRPIGDDCVVFIEPTKREILSYEMLDAHKTRVAISLEELSKHPQVEIHNDLIDSRIYICAPDVLMLFTENFDYQDVSRDFMRGVIQSEILSNTLHAHIVTDAYAAFIQSFRTYDAACRDVLLRWTAPMVPDATVADGQVYSYRRGHIYLAEDVTLARSTKLIKNVAVGARSSIAGDTVILNSVIGANCRIGANVRLENAYLFNGVVVGDNCVVQHAILGDGVELLADVRVKANCVVGNNVVVGPNIVLPEFTRLADPAAIDDGDSDEEEGGAEVRDIEVALVGTHGTGVRYVRDEEDDDSDDETQKIDVDKLPFADFAASEVTEEELQAPSDDDSDGDDETNDFEMFMRELHATVARAISSRISAENTLVEINSLKYAYNSTFRDCYVGVLSELLRQITARVEEKGPGITNQHVLEFEGQLRVIGKTWANVLRKLVGKSHGDQRDALGVIVEHCAGVGGVCAVSFGKILQAMYDQDIIEEEPIIAWYNAPTWSSETNEAKKALHQRAAKFVVWLQEAEEEDDDEDEDEDSD